MAAFLTSVIRLCEHSGNDWYRVYLIRKICSLKGVDHVQNLLCEDQFMWLFPQVVLQMVGFSVLQHFHKQNNSQKLHCNVLFIFLLE